LPWYDRFGAGSFSPAALFSRPISPRKSRARSSSTAIFGPFCFVCHGPDNNLRKAKLRLDDEKDAHSKVIEKGEPLFSEMFRRLVTDEPDKIMPPRKTMKKLTKAEIQLIFEWIEQGAT
jgi:mono/diheme cytochrome c family protein